MDELLNLSLTTESKDCILDKLTLYETIDIKILNKLISSSLLKQTFNNPFSTIYYENEREQLKKYLLLIKDNKAKVQYTRAKNINYGRVSPKNALGLFSFRREIRHTLSKENYIDIDIVCCHHSILFQICEQNNIECNNLKYYINNREIILEEIKLKYNVKKDIAKQLFIQLLYFGSFNSWIENNNIENKETSSFIINFQNEIKLIGEIIVLKNNKLKKVIEKQKEEKNIRNYNMKGSICSYFLQDYECKILETIYNYCVENRYIINNNAVLCADGLMIEKNLFKTELLDELNKLILNTYGLNLKFINKEMSQCYSIEEIMNNQINKNEYEILKEEFEKNNFKIREPFMFGTIRKNGSLFLQNRTDFINVHENLLYKNVKSIETSFISSWLKDPKMRTYDKIEFMPCQETPNNIYNSFNGFKGEKSILQKEDIENSLIMKHIKEVICNNNEEIYNYFIKYLSNLIQHPNKKSNTSLILKSIQGAGKDTILNWFGNNILGKEYYINEDNIELIFGKFNSCIENKILVVLNEASGKDTFTINEKIKNAITRNINIIEHKGLKPYENTNNIGYIFLTNNENPIKIPYDDRRFCGIECNGSVANNNNYFNLLYEEINGGYYDRAFYNFFKSVNLENYDFINKRPITNFYNNMKEMNIPILVKFFENVIDKNVRKISASDFFSYFNEFIKNNNLKCEYTSTKFGIDIKSYEGIEKKRTVKGCDIIINIDVLKDYLINKYNSTFNNIEFINSDNE